MSTQTHRRNVTRAGILLSTTMTFSVLAAAQIAAPSSQLSAPHSVSTAPVEPSVISLAAPAQPHAAALNGEHSFKNAPSSYHVFDSAKAGEDAGVESLTLNFSGATTLTKITSKSKDFVVESGGTCQQGGRFAKGDSCTLLVSFHPQSAGNRLGSITVENSADVHAFSLGLVGNGYAPVISFTPAVITTVPATVSGSTGSIKSATSLAVDGGDIVYVADTGNNLLKQLDSSGTITPTSPAFATPASIAVDSAGIIYSANTTGSTYYFSFYTPWGSQTAYGYTYAAGTCTPSTPCALNTVGLSRPTNLSMDAYDNLFFEEGTKGAAEMPVASISGGSGSLKLWYLTDQYSYSSGNGASFAADASGNIYTFYNYGSTCVVFEEPLYNAEYSPTANRVAGGSKCGFSGDGGQGRSAEISTSLGQMAFDIAGNLYFADAGNQRVRRIDNATGIINTIAGTGTAGYSGDGGAATSATLSAPTGVGVDSQGQVYILSNAPTAGPTQVLRKIGPNGYLNFGSQPKGVASTAHTVTVSNTGNSQLTLISALITGANASDFTIDPGTTNCALTANAVLNAGQSCKIGFIFNPAATGTRTASLVLNGNTVTGSNIIQLTGNSVSSLPSPTMTVAWPGSGANITTGSALGFKVTLAGSPTPTGTVTMTLDGVTVSGSPATIASGLAYLYVSTAVLGSHTLKAVYNGDSNWAAGATASVTYNVVAAAAKCGTCVVGHPEPISTGPHHLSLNP